jgi:hypothetical protein
MFEEVTYVLAIATFKDLGDLGFGGMRGVPRGKMTMMQPPA